jgi:hypothetical protein
MKTNSIAAKAFKKTRGQRINTRLLGLGVVCTLLAVVFTFGVLASSTSRSSTGASSPALAFSAPVVACPTNVALASYGSTAVASSQYNANYPASGAIDGEHNGNTWGAGGGWSDGTRGVFSDNVQVNFNVSQTISQIDVYTLKNQPNNGSVVNDTTPATSYGITNFNVQYWTGAAWVDVPGGAVTGNTLAKRSFTFPDITTDKIRVVVNDSADHLYSRVVEIEAFSCTPAVVPTPTPTPCTDPSNNVARRNGAVAIGSSQYNANYPASGAIDGEHNGNNWGAGGGWSDGTRGVFSDNVEINFKIDQPIQEIDVYTLKNSPNNGSVVNDTTPATSYGITSFNVQYWNGSAFVDVPGGAVTGNTLAKRKFIFPTITTNRIRVVVNDSADHLYSRIVEIEAFSCTPTTIRCVNPGGEDGCFSSIQAAINASNPGDVINVDAGTYSENLTLSKRLILRGAFAGAIGCGRNEDESNITAASGTLLTLQTGSAGSIIDGFSFTGGARGINSLSGPLDNLRILNNRVVGFTTNGISLNDPGSDITISRNAVDGSSKVGTGDLIHLDIDTFNGFYLTDNCITNGAAIGNGTGFLVDGNRNVGPSATRNPLISGNTFDNNQNGANLGIRSLNNGTIRGNTFSNSRFDGLQGGPKNTLITGNNFTANGKHGLNLTSFGNFTGDPTGGAQLNTVTCNNMTDNGFLNSGSGITFGALQAPGTISSNHINFNNITGNNIGASYTGTETIDAESNWWNAADGPSGAYPGSGDSVSSTNIDVLPFLTSSSDCSTLTTSPANQRGWLAQVTSADGLAQFVGSPPLPIFSSGSLRLFTGTHGDESAQFRNSNYDGTSLSTVTSLGYCTYVTQWNGAQVPYLILNVDRDNNGSVDDLLFFEPEYSRGTYTAAIPAQQAPALNTWQCWQAHRGGWYAIDADTGDPTFGGPGADVLPLSGYVTANPNAVLRNTTRGAVRIVSGFASPSDVFNSYTDFFRIGVGSTQTVFDFDPVP